MHLTTENTKKNYTKSTEFSKISVPFVRLFSVDFVVKKKSSMHLTTENTKKNRTKPTEFSKILVSSLRYFSVDFVLKKNIGHAFNRGEHEEKPHKVHGVF